MDYDEIIARQDELAKRFEDFEPRSEDVRPAKPLLNLRAAMEAVEQAVRSMRAAGYSWSAIAMTLGQATESVRQQYEPTVGPAE